MSKVQVIRPNEVLAEDARQNFADHVQSIAFNLTLSRRMVGMLQLVRDNQVLFGDGLDQTNQEAMARRERERQVITNGRSGVNGNFLSLHHALQRRGLCYRPIEVDANRNDNRFWAREKWNLPILKLTRAGELVCELLVEAGLMPAKIPAEQKKRKTK